jgi:hypothetical protein
MRDDWRPWRAYYDDLDGVLKALQAASDAISQAEGAEAANAERVLNAFANSWR